MTKQPLWTSTEIKKATKGKFTGKWKATGVSIDTRTLKKGDLYVALKGENFDGHDFVKEAFKKGAIAALVSRDVDGIKEGANLVKVADTFKALRDMARYRREHSKAKIVAITGSVGKTTVKDNLKKILEAGGKVYATEGNLNNHIGLPLSICRMTGESEFGVFELGMNHAGEISNLSKLLRPNIAVITAVEAVHMEFFNSVADIADAKAEIFDGIEKGGVAIIPTNNDHFDRLKNAVGKKNISEIITFGGGPWANYRLVGRQESEGAQSIRANLGDRGVIYNISALGKHNALNSLAVFAAAKACGIDEQEITKHLSEMSSPDGRGKIYKIKKTPKSKGTYALIDDSYNASPASMRASFEVLSQVKNNHQGRAIAVLGDMLELGDESTKYHTELAGDIVESKIDLVFTAGDLMVSLYNELPRNMRGESEVSWDKLLPKLKKFLQVGDVVLIKGSHGSNMWQLASKLKG